MNALYHGLRLRLMGAWAWWLNVKFNLHLELVCWWYKGGANVPPNKLPRMVPFKNAQEETNFYHLVKACGYLNKICDHYRLDSAETWVGQALGVYMSDMPMAQELQAAVQGWLDADHIPQALYQAMIKAGDISDQKLRYFATPHPYATMNNWLLALEQPSPLIVEGING